MFLQTIIRIRYFFIKDCIENGDLFRKYSPTGQIYADLFTTPLQGATFSQFRAMIQGITKSTPDVDMICPRAMAKVTLQEYVVQNDKYTRGTATARTDACGVTCTDACRRMFMDTQTRGSTRKDSGRSTLTEDRVSACTDATCMEDLVSAWTDVSTDSTGVHRSMYPYISTKFTVVHGLMQTKKFKAKTALCGRKNTYDEYRR